MVNKELTDYIRSVKEKGYPDAAIKEQLLKYNYSQDVIDEAFREILQPVQPAQPTLPPQQPPIMPVSASVSTPASQTPVILTEKKENKKKKGFPVILLVIFLLLLFGGAAFAVWKFVPLPSFSIGGDIPECENTAVDIYRIKGEPVVCVYTDNSKVQYIIVNSGSTILNKVEVTIKGSKGNSADELDNLELNPGIVFPRTLIYDYPSKGDARGITILPYVSVNGNAVACYNKKISYDTIKIC
jgi:hypothetical protein